MTPDTPHLPDTTPTPVTPAKGDVPDIPGYEVERLIGRGGMGRVYKARHRGLNRVVAIKVLIGAADDPKQVARFEQEAKAVASLHHANIAQIFDSGTADGAPYYAMEYVPGGTLAEALAGRPLTAADAARVAEAIAHGVQHAHDHGIIHRDLKPGNILLGNADCGLRIADSPPLPTAGETTPDFQSAIRNPQSAIIKVADFGLAKRFADETKITHTGEILGTPSYMAPEQASGVVAKVGPAADVYAVGAILYECLTGRPPFAAPDPMATILQALTMEPVPPRRLQPKLPADLETVCLKCLEKSPRKRYATAGDLAADLRRFLDGSPVVARPVPAWERAWKWARRKPWAATAAGLAGVVLIGAAVGVTLLQAAYSKEKSLNNDLEQTNGRLAQSLNDLAAQKSETDTVLKLALDDLRTFTFDVSNRLADVPNSEEFRRDMLENARKSLAAIDQLRPKDFTVREYAMVGYDKLAAAENRLGRFPAALESSRRALQLADELTAEYPDVLSLKVKQARYHSLIALLAARLGQPKEEESHMAVYADKVTALAREHPDHRELLKMKAHLHAFESAQALKIGDTAKADAAVRDYAEAYARLAALDPADPAAVLDAADAQMNLVSNLSNRNKHAEAEALLVTVEKALAALPGPPTVRGRKTRANLEWTRADVTAALKKYPEAEAACLAAVREFEGLLADFPKTRDLRLTLAQVHWRHGRVWGEAGQPAKARPPLLKAKAILDQLAADKLGDAQSKEILGYVEALLAEGK